MRCVFGKKQIGFRINFAHRLLRSDLFSGWRKIFRNDVLFSGVVTKMQGLSFVLFSLLGGCSTPPLAKPMAVEVPVAVSCRAPVVLHPVWPFEGLSGQASLYEKVRALLAENELRKAYEVKLEAAVEACRAD